MVMVFFGCADSREKTTTAESGENIASLLGPSGWLHPVDFSHDGAYLAVGGEEGFVHIYDAQVHLQRVQQQEMVRIIYFLPNDRPARPERVAALRDLIRETQLFFADEMQRHGYGRKTFNVETNASGKPLIHHFDGKFEDAYYHKNTPSKVWEEITEQIDSNPANIALQFETETTVKMLPPIEVPPNGVRIRFEIKDPDGLHQAQLYIPTTDKDPVEGSGFKLHSCRSLSGEVSTLEFITTELPREDMFLRLRVMDVRGNFSWWNHLILIHLLKLAMVL